MIRTISSNDTFRRAGAAVGVAAAVFLFAGCGGAAPGATPKATDAPASAPAAGKVLEITGSEYAFSPVALKAPAGPTTIRFVNKGVVEHDFTIESLKIHITAAGGKTAEAKVDLKPGTYKSVCTVPGHLQSGMKGTLTVS